MREWQTVTVALAASSSRATGTPTSFERPTTTASAPSSSTPSWRSSSITPAGVQGTRPGVPWASRPALSGVRPSTSLPGSIAATTASGSIWAGTRQLHEDAVDVVVRAERARPAPAAPPRWSPPSSPWWTERIPTSSQAWCLLRDVDLRGRVVADDHRRQGRHPAGLLARRRRRRPAPARAPRRRPPCRRSSAPPPATASGSGRSRPSACARSRRRRSGRRPRRPARPPVTTPSPKLAWTTSSPVCSSSAGPGSIGCAGVGARRPACSRSCRRRRADFWWRSVSSTGSSSMKREGRLRSARPNRRRSRAQVM